MEPINLIVLIIVAGAVGLAAQYYIIKAAVGNALTEHRSAQAKSRKPRAN